MSGLLCETWGLPSSNAQSYLSLGLLTVARTFSLSYDVPVIPRTKRSP
jgi:hypothetical protein